MVLGGLLSFLFDVFVKQSPQKDEVKSVAVEASCKCGVVKSCDCQPVVKNEPVAELSRNKVTLYWREGCAPCARWKQQERARFQAAGYEIVEVKDELNAVPWFRMSVGGKEFLHTGYLSLESAQSIAARK